MLNRPGTAGPIYAALIAFSLAMLIAMTTAIQSGWEVENEYVPNVRAVAHFKLDSTLAHLWFEELLSGDSNESMEEVWRLLDSAHFYLDAMTHGAADAQGPIVPLDDPQLQRRILDVDIALSEFRAITAERLAVRESAVPGTAIDQQYDEVFEELLALANDVELRLQDVIGAESTFVRRIQFAVMLGAAILSVLLGLTFTRYIRKRIEAENTLQLKVKAEEDARKSLGDLAHVARLNTMNELAAGIAHEVNQPLTAIMMSAGACRQLIAAGRHDSKEFAEAMEVVGSQAERAGNVIRQLRGFVTKAEVSYEPVDINELVRMVEKLTMFDPQMMDFNIQLELAENLPAVEVEVVQIQQVILNLVRNAVESVAGSGNKQRPIRVRTRLTENRTIEVSVKDEGVGLSEAAEERLFQPFSTTKKSGMGMGLSISDSIITAHGGRIWYERNEDVPGATFAFELPLSREQNES